MLWYSRNYHSTVKQLHSNSKEKENANFPLPNTNQQTEPKHSEFYCFFLDWSPWQAWGHHVGANVVLPGPPALLEFEHKIILLTSLILLCYMTKSSFLQLWARAGYRWGSGWALQMPGGKTSERPASDSCPSAVAAYSTEAPPAGCCLPANNSNLLPSSSNHLSSNNSLLQLIPCTAGYWGISRWRWQQMTAAASIWALISWVVARAFPLFSPLIYPRS